MEHRLIKGWGCVGISPIWWCIECIAKLTYLSPNKRLLAVLLPVPPVETPASMHAAVRIERLRNPTQWEAWRFRIQEVLVDEGQFGQEMRVLRDDGDSAQWLFPRLPVHLYKDEAEGYYLNLTSGSPVWFVMWRIDDADPSRAWPEIVTLSYNEAGRWLDAQERVDNCPLAPEVVALLTSYVEAHYRPEPKKRKRPNSFVAPEERS